MIDLDFTFFIQFVNFVITLVVLNFLLIRPIRDIIAKRKTYMSGMVDDADQFIEQAESKLENYQKQLTEARAEGTLKRNTLKEEGLSQEKSILTAAGEDASRTLKSEQESVASQMKEAMQELKGQINELATEATNKILA